MRVFRYISEGAAIGHSPDEGRFVDYMRPRIDGSVDAAVSTGCSHYPNAVILEQFGKFHRYFSFIVKKVQLSQMLTKVRQKLATYGMRALQEIPFPDHPDAPLEDDFADLEAFSDMVAQHQFSRVRRKVDLLL